MTYLYHGTDKKSANDIIKRGIDMSKSEKGYFGRGFYTATTPTNLEYPKIYAADNSKYDATGTDTNGAYISIDTDIAVTIRIPFVQVVGIKITCSTPNLANMVGIFTEAKGCLIDSILMIYNNPLNSIRACFICNTTVTGSWSSSEYNVIRNCLFYAIDTGTYNLFTNLRVTNGVNNHYYRLENNTFTKAGDNGIYGTCNVLGKKGWFQFYNNIVLDSTLSDYLIVPTSGTADIDADYNMASDTTLTTFGGTGNLENKTASNQFVNTSNDYTLKVTADALNAGQTRPDFNYDAIGVNRPQGASWDMGALERT